MSNCATALPKLSDGEPLFTCIYCDQKKVSLEGPLTRGQDRLHWVRNDIFNRDI